jgi:hypothetical protein
VIPEMKKSKKDEVCTAGIATEDDAGGWSNFKNEIVTCKERVKLGWPFFLGREG